MSFLRVSVNRRDMKIFPGFAVRKSHAPPTQDLRLAVKPAVILNTHIIIINTKTRVIPKLFGDGVIRYAF